MITSQPGQDRQARPGDGLQPGQPIEVWRGGAWHSAAYQGAPGGFRGRAEDPLVNVRYPGGTPFSIQRSQIRPAGAGPADQPPPSAATPFAAPRHRRPRRHRRTLTKPPQPAKAFQIPAAPPNPQQEKRGQP